MRFLFTLYITVTITNTVEVPTLKFSKLSEVLSFLKSSNQGLDNIQT